MPVCSTCGTHAPGGRFCSECGAPFTMKEAPPPFNPKQQPPHLPPHFQEQVFNEERDQKSLLYQPQQKNGNVPPAIPVVYVEQNRSSYDGNLPSAAPVSPSTETNSGSRLPSANGGAGMFKGRYSDHPNCDICGLAFDVTKRRHQWYGVSCSYCFFCV